METEGLLAPAATAEVREQYDAVGTAAQVAAREVAKAIGLDADEYQERVDEDVVLTAREAIFASLLSIHRGTREEFDAWVDDLSDDPAVSVRGSDHVSGVVWHHAPVVDRVVAATFEDEPAAAAHALRRQAFATIYREVV